VNTLSAEDQPLADIFAGRSGLKGEDKFTNGVWEGGVLKSAIVSFECVIDAHSRIGTHEVIFGRVEAIHLGDANNSALLYRNRGYIKIA
jgi:flavin reductase